MKLHIELSLVGKTQVTRDKAQTAFPDPCTTPVGEVVHAPIVLLPH